MSEIIYISGGTLSFPSLVEARAGAEGAKPKFGCDIILPTSHPSAEQIMQRISEVAQTKWKEQAAPVLQAVQSDRKLRCWGNGNEKLDKKTYKPFAGYEGNFFVSAASETQPQMVDTSGQVADPANTMLCQALARKLYGGCKVNVAIRFWPQDNKYGRGIRCELIAIQFAGDGTPFGESTPDVSGVFGAVQLPTTGAVPNGAPVPQPVAFQPAPFQPAPFQPAPFQPAPFQPAAPAPAFGVPSFLS